MSAEAGPLAGPVRDDFVIVHWHPDVAYETIPRMYSDWNVARSDIEAWLGDPGDVFTWKETKLWSVLRALSYSRNGTPQDGVLVECGLITRPGCGLPPQAELECQDDPAHGVQRVHTCEPAVDSVWHLLACGHVVVLDKS